MAQVRFYDCVKDELLIFAVIIARYRGKWVLCKHKDRNTYEVPGGHREEGESILEAAKRELYEETGATAFDLQPVCVYSVIDEDTKGAETYGMLYFAEIQSCEKELHSEIEKILLTQRLTEKWTYPQIQPKLIEEALRRGFSCV